MTQGLLQQYPNLKGIISPTTVGIAAAAAVLDTAKYRGKIALTGLGTPDEMKKYVADGTVKEFELWNPANLGYLAAYAAVETGLRQDHRRHRPDVHRRQARQLHRRRGQHRAARPALRLRLLQHRQVQLLTQIPHPVIRTKALTRRPCPDGGERTAAPAAATRRHRRAVSTRTRRQVPPLIPARNARDEGGASSGTRLLPRAGPARPAGRVPRAAPGGVAGDAGGAGRRPAGATTRSSWPATACSSATWRPTTTRPRSTRWRRPRSTGDGRPRWRSSSSPTARPTSRFTRLDEIFHLDYTEMEMTPNA